MGTLSRYQAVSIEAVPVASLTKMDIQRSELQIRKLESQTGHTAVGTTNQSFVVKREVMAGFLMGFPS